VTVSLSDFLRYGATYSVYVFLTNALTGVVLASYLSSRKQARAPVEASAAIALLLGLAFHIVSWAGLRWVGFGYNGVKIFHAAAVLLLATIWLDGERRRRGLAILRSYFSREAWLFWIIALAAAAYFTYAPIQNYYNDEPLRVGVAAAASRSFPAQTPFIWKGLLKYHYEADFYAGSTSAAIGIPLAILYFRFLLLFNWSLLFFALRGIVRQAKPTASRYWPVAVFCLFFLAHGNQVTHLTFRENSFALGLAILGISTLWTGLIVEDAAAIAVACAAAAPVSFAKAPCGALYVAFVCLLLILFAHARKISKTFAAAAGLLCIAGFALTYRIFLTGARLGSGGHLLKIGFDLGSLQEFAPYLFVNPMLIRLLVKAHIPLMRDVLFVNENLLTLARLSALPLLSFAAFFLRGAARNAWQDETDAALLLKAAFGTFLTASFLFCFVHYRISDSSDRYWVWFGLWIFSGIAYALLPLIPNPRNLPRALRLASAFMLLVAAGYTLRFWPLVRWHANSNVENWSPEYYSACRYIDEHAAPDDVILHNIDYKKHESLIGFCTRRFFVSYTEHNGVFEDFSLTDKSWSEARSFFNGETVRPLEWLRSRGIRYVYWDFAGPQFRFAEVAARSPFLHEVLKDGSVALYRVDRADNHDRTP
jgi:hypothetical protein